MGIRLFVIGLNFFAAVLTGAGMACDIRDGRFGWAVLMLFLSAMNIYYMLNGLMALTGVIV